MAGDKIKDFDNAYAAIDDRDAPYLQETAAGLISSGGLTAGALLGYMNANRTMDSFIRTEIDKLKRQSKVTMREKGPQVAADEFGHAKAEFMKNVEPKRMGIPSVDHFGASPRNLRHMAAGALLGGVTAIAPTYLAARGDQIE